MPIQLWAYERRDGVDRRDLGNTALQLCRIVRRREGITSAKFYWYGTEAVVFLLEGEAAALSSPGQADQANYAAAGFAIADMARLIMNWRLTEPRSGEESYRLAGR